MSNHFIIFDLEFTCWDDVGKTMWTGENQYREVVQIGALKVDKKTLDVIDALNLLVKPKINPILTDIFIRLTNITQEQVDAKGLDFPAAYDCFNEFCGHALVFSYGPDMFVLGENVALNHCHPRGAFCRDGMGFVNIGPYLARCVPDETLPNSGRLWQHFNLPKPHEADEHDALFDCYSILAAIRHLQGQGHVLPL